jgi:hypothetical protein
MCKECAKSFLHIESLINKEKCNSAKYFRKMKDYKKMQKINEIDFLKKIVIELTLSTEL